VDLIVDASVIVAALVDSGADSQWAAGVIGSGSPHLTACSSTRPTSCVALPWLATSPRMRRRPSRSRTPPILHWQNDPTPPWPPWICGSWICGSSLRLAHGAPS
jgi:hypothetical protein